MRRRRMNQEVQGESSPCEKKEKWKALSFLISEEKFSFSTFFEIIETVVSRCMEVVSRESGDARSFLTAKDRMAGQSEMNGIYQIQLEEIFDQASSSLAEKCFNLGFVVEPTQPLGKIKLMDGGGK